ncbi:MAG: hypothetical protein H6695_08455 [Deferribacteres bacterium]|nr:hypothetical protein [candidate division KSB1 bacterium]MCB9510199.1 hypothetical protein [Deferribacteres bacterium]
MTADQITAIATVSIALLALFVSIWQGALARKHNRLSVKPFLQVETSIVEPFGVWVHNKGVGPAIIATAQVYKNGKRIGNSSDSDSADISKRESILAEFGLNKEWINFGFWDAKALALGAVSAGESVQILGLTSKLNKENQQKFIQSLQSFGLKIEYKSVYAEKSILKHNI